MDSGLTSYRGALDRLFARTGSTSNFGLDRTRAFLELLDNPQGRFECFHVAGTNGKGSVVATLYRLLRAKGLRVGHYTSPHLVDFRERIVVDEEEISEAEVETFLARWEGESERLGATFFELTTVLALQHFAEREVDVAIIETGLGGRLDSTNVVLPVVAGVTSIGIEHTEYLGESIAEIAREKGGIFKTGVPAVFGPVSPSARDALLAAARDGGAVPVIESEQLFRAYDVRVAADGTTFNVEHQGQTATLRTALLGEAQATNACVALAMLYAAGEPYRTTISEARASLPAVSLPGRFQRLGKFILDVAHNPDAIKMLVATLHTVAPPRPLIAVLGILRDKNWREIMDILCPVMDCTIVTSPPSAPAERAWNPSEAFDYGLIRGWAMKLLPDLNVAIATAAEAGATVVIAGSFHTVGDALLSGSLR